MIPFASTRVRLILLVILAAATCGQDVLALEKTELALICNKRMPASVQNAKAYAEARGVPLDRIIELDLPTSDQIGEERFDPDVVFPIRQALAGRGLKAQVKCLVTFYGVPLKLMPRRNSPLEASELQDLQAQERLLTQRIAEVVSGLEGHLRDWDATFKPLAGEDLDALTKRADHAFTAGGRMLAEAAPDLQRQVLSAMLATVQQLSGESGIVQRTQPKPTTGPSAVSDQWQGMRRDVVNVVKQSGELIALRTDPAARAKLRELSLKTFGLVDTVRLLHTQIDYLTPQSIIALDSELAFLWFNTYARKGIPSNPLHYREANRAKSAALMVMRLDGPQTGTAREIVMACKKVERDGVLDGRFVIDSRGLVAKRGDGFGTFDERLRDLASLVRKKTKLSLVSDDAAEVIPAHSVKDVALYVGWYSVRNYIPSCSFVPGAIGYHVASFEMFSLHDPNEKGWGRGMLNDGIAATLGAVDEPYLGAFPDPVDFFALILCGKYTLAEVYWMTTPTVNWKMVMIGDPLYNPFGGKPAIAPEDLPNGLRQIVMSK